MFRSLFLLLRLYCNFSSNAFVFSIVTVFCHGIFCCSYLQWFLWNRFSLLLSYGKAAAFLFLFYQSSWTTSRLLDIGWFIFFNCLSRMCYICFSLVDIKWRHIKINYLNEIRFDLIPFDKVEDLFIIYTKISPSLMKIIQVSMKFWSTVVKDYKPHEKH